MRAGRVSSLNPRRPTKSHPDVELQTPPETRELHCLVVIAGSLAIPILRAEDRSFKRTEDVVYGRKFGSALTMDVFQPTGPANGLGVIAIMSGGWYSGHEMINPDAMKFWTDRGYTAFAVVHGSQPRYTIPEVVADMNRAVRFIRFHAADYGVDPDRLGVCGSSAGGHLSLMLGTAGHPGNPNATDPVDRVVQPGPGRRLLLPADRLPQLRQARRGRHRRGDPQGFRRPVRLPGDRPEDQEVPAHHRPRQGRGDRPRHLPRQPRQLRRPPNPHHPRRRRHPRPDPAV